MTRVLGIESSCDETATAVVEDGRSLVASSVASSRRLHARFGGVVPEIAAREHTMAILPVVEEVLDAAGMRPADVDAVAVTEGPGLLGALLVGVTFAKALAQAIGKPVVGVHHLEAHLYANALVAPLRLPAVALLVSGGHTALYWWRDHGDLAKLGETRDDAAGEAFDKGARLLGLSYPGGPLLEQLAATTAGGELRLPVAALGGETLDFSFSGVKTATRELVRQYPERRAEIAHALQEAVVEALVRTTERALARLRVSQLYLAGGVTANRRLRERFVELGAKYDIPVGIPPIEYCTDNAAMVAAAGYWRLGAGHVLSPFASARTPYPLGE